MLGSEELFQEIRAFQQKWYALFATLGPIEWGSDLEELQVSFVTRLSDGFHAERDILNEKINEFYKKYAGFHHIGREEFPPLRLAYNEAAYGIEHIIPSVEKSR